MKLCLIWPRSSLSLNPDVMEDPTLYDLMDYYYSMASHKPFPSVGAALPLVAALTPPIFDEIRIVDGNSEEIPFDTKFDLVGISMMTAQADEGYRIAEEFRKRGVYTVAGGIHPTVMPGEAACHTDTVIVGEAEETWPRFIEDLVNGHPHRTYRPYRRVDLSTSPVPRYDLLPSHGTDSYAYVQTSRGCPNRCDYCSISQTYGSKYRYKSPDQIIREIKTVQRLYPSTKIFFSDDNMFTDRHRVKPLLESINRLNITWASQSDISIAKDEELLESISKSGCEYLFVGLESVTKEGIGHLSKWKRTHFDSYAESVRIIQSHGIPVLGAFIVGTDDHDESVFENLIDFIELALLQKTHISVLTPLPGTLLRQRFHEENRLLNKPWRNYDFFGVNYKPKNITAHGLQSGLLETMIFLSHWNCRREAVGT